MRARGTRWGFLRRPRFRFQSPLGLACWSEPVDGNEDDHNSFFWLVQL